ncbi:hypothetical protein AB0I22_12710 [Streptomyces sp. NPDC050610]|uniref:hypothetical protein n=1 Tax=Streptomyces sp. NPDC050610 TaxID=3157097 RepID=UPI00342FAF32
MRPPRVLAAVSAAALALVLAPDTAARALAPEVTHVAAHVLVPEAAPAPVAVRAAPGDPGGKPPGCGAARGAEFPVSARIGGGPATYERGAGWRGWRLELRDATGAGCRAVHPVAVLADRGRALKPRDIRMEFYDAGARRWWPVRFVRTDEAENVGVFGGGSSGAPGFSGFTLPAGRSVVVPVRQRFTGAAPEGPVTENVTAVRRRAGDGDWVGQSGDYAFTVRRPDAHGGRLPGESAGHPSDGIGDGDADGRGSAPPALADTGSGTPLLGLGVASAVLVLGGGALLAGSRRQRP